MRLRYRNQTVRNRLRRSEILEYARMTPADVISTYSRCTGIRFRFLPDGVSRQSVKFLERGFTLADLELVVLWIKRGISRRECGFNAASLGWRCLFGEYGSSDEMLKFQERLGLAEEAVKRGWRPSLTSTRNGTEKPASAPKHPPEQKVSEEEGKRTAGLLGALRNELEGRG